MHWWQSGVIYQIYPRSFQDTNGDGVGDLKGIAARLPYLVELGVDAIWLSPIFVSPMADFGYDIADYTGIDPLFGTLDDFDALLGRAHALGLKVLLDFVPNHTSNRHPWFAESRVSRQSAKREWYIWRNGASEGGPPNNWLSEFGGSAWEYDAASDQYFYHAFLREQPDLNWRNPAVRAAMHDVMRFWLDRGVDGFRVDVIWHLIKDEAFRDNPPNPDFSDGEPAYRALLPLYSTDRPEVHEVVRELRAVIDEFPDRVLIGEVYLPVEKLAAYYGDNLTGAHLPFNFALIETPWRADAIASLIDRYENSLPPGAWPNWVLGNHDRPRLASRIGAEQARVAAMLLLTLPGTPFLYYGDELGMTQAAIPPGRIRDPWGINVPGLGRDGCRTPMPWAASALAGFSTAEPWLPLADDSGPCNVESAGADPASLLNLYRKLLALRRAHPALAEGSYRPVAQSGNVLAYERVLASERLLMALNFGSKTENTDAISSTCRGTWLLSSAVDRPGGPAAGPLVLRPHEGVIISLG
ncbi:MAG: alpha-amylase family glycosyl hydrolase [Pseudolabrys sp.]|nr:alpha-amylase family glycosyl hydrolase [Pseudolabrys sp.]MDP2298835.1 alpha-amylase family glycosyl hydrolase [Pseudolabrys sp.]